MAVRFGEGLAIGIGHDPGLGEGDNLARVEPVAKHLDDLLAGNMGESSNKKNDCQGQRAKD